MRVFIFFFCSIVCVLGIQISSHAHAESLPYEIFRQIPVQHEGRIKPLDTLAQIHLQQFYGDDEIEGRPAIAWLAESFFTPNKAITRPLFYVKDTRLLDVLEIHPQAAPYYSFESLATAFERKRDTVLAILEKEEKARTLFEEDLLLLYQKVETFFQITGAFTLFLPSQQPIPETVSAQREMDYLTYLSVKPQIEAMVHDAVAAYGESLEEYPSEAANAAMLAYHMQAIASMGEKNNYLRIIPEYLGDAKLWHSPWSVLNQGKGSPKGEELLSTWKKLAIAYMQADAQAWQQASVDLMRTIEAHPSVTAWQLHLEVLYHQLTLKYWVIAGYILACIIMVIAGYHHRFRPVWGTYFFATTLLAHLLLIIMRILILERPPVSDLYESILFVSAVCAALGWWMDRRTGQALAKITGAILAALLLLVSEAYAGEGDTLGVVIAVLNTNFWLATHVICITLGYGAALLAGTLAHLWLAKYPNTTFLPMRMIHSCTLLALLLTAIGTILGGIWADQSWGRFWGWDPKENGALLIVLWLVWALHGKIAGQLNDVSFAAILAVTNIIVALSWFGVNLLGVGLHSYGFTDNAMYGLIAFCVVELGVIITLYVRTKRNIPC